MSPRRPAPGEDSDPAPRVPVASNIRCPDHPDQLIRHYVRADARGYCKECPPR